MPINQTKIYLYVLFPILLIAGVLGISLSNYPVDLSPMCLSFLMSLLISWGWLFSRYITRELIDPIYDLDQRLEEPETKLTPNSYPNGSIIQSLVVKLRNRARILDEDLQENLAETLALECASERKHITLEKRNDQLDIHIRQLKNDAEITNNYIQMLGYLAQIPLQETINNARSLMQKSTSDQHEKYITNLMRNTGNLHFLIMKLKSIDYFDLGQSQTKSRTTHKLASNQTNVSDVAIIKTAPVDIHNLVDSVIALLSPILSPTQCELIPIFDQSCRFQPLVNETQVKGLLFHVLLNHFAKSHFEIPRQQRNCQRPTLSGTASKKDYSPQGYRQIALKIKIESKELLFELDDDKAIETTAELDRLMDTSNSSLQDKRLIIPARTSVKSNPIINTQLNYRIFCVNRMQFASLSSRLGNIGAKVSQDPSKAEVAFIFHQQPEDIQTEVKKLQHPSKICLLKRDLVYQKNKWHQLIYPICQTDLIRILKPLSKPAQQQQQQLVLVVDDSSQNRRVLGELILSLGHTVIETGTPKQALEIVKTHKLDVIFTDLQMPEMNGADFSRQTRETGFDGRIYCVIADTSTVASSAILRSGLSQVISKPVSIDMLARLLNTESYSANIPRHSSRHSSPHSSRPLALGHSKIFNHTVAMQRANYDANLMEELMEMLIESLPEDIRSLKECIAVKSIDELQQRTHKMIGALRYCAVPRLTQAIVDLDNTIRKFSTLEKDSLSAEMKTLEAEFTALNSWYTQRTEHSRFEAR